MILDSVQEFYLSYSQKKGHILAIDYGLKKTGLALSTLDHSFSMPLSILRSYDQDKIVPALKEIVQNKNVIGIVIGLPIGMDGNYTSQTIMVQEFANKLSNAIDLPIFLQDERLSSKAADSALKQMGMKRIQRNEIDDMVAANMILETVLDCVKKITR